MPTIAVLAVADRHHLAVVGRRAHLQRVGHLRGGQRVVATAFERARQALEEALAVVLDEARALPWTSRRAGPTSPPKASTIAWWPRQTPSVGTRGPSRPTISTLAPASPGRPRAGR